MITGRLRPGVTLGEAQAEGARIGERLADDYPSINAGWVVQVRTTDHSIMGDQAATIMTVLMLTVGLVLLIACANVANLVLVRASARMREIGLRMALGAERASVLRLVLGQGGKLLLFGTPIGLVIAFLLSRMVASLLFGISSTDPVSFIGVPLVLILIALAANFIPAQRATRIDPMRTLRSE
jgi:ABC-type antimicrobial peptide transport system permease subunit